MGQQRLGPPDSTWCPDLWVAGQEANSYPQQQIGPPHPCPFHPLLGGPLSGTLLHSLFSGRAPPCRALCHLILALCSPMSATKCSWVQVATEVPPSNQSSKSSNPWGSRLFTLSSQTPVYLAPQPPSNLHPHFTFVCLS